MSCATIGCGLRSMTPVRSPPPQRRAHDLEAPGGRGLELLDALASRWGALGGPEGRVVWFELDLGASRSRGRHPSSSELDR